MIAGRIILLTGDNPVSTMTSKDWEKLRRQADSRLFITASPNIPPRTDAIEALARKMGQEVVPEQRKPEPRFTAKGEIKRRPWK